MAMSAWITSPALKNMLLNQPSKFCAIPPAETELISGREEQQAARLAERPAQTASDAEVLARGAEDR